jgi:hypothetical protein
MSLFRLLVLAASLAFVASSSFAQDKDRAAPEAPKGAEKTADKQAGPRQVIQISRSTKPNCDIKPVMTDDEIARCKKAWAR